MLEAIMQSRDRHVQQQYSGRCLSNTQLVLRGLKHCQENISYTTITMFMPNVDLTIQMCKQKVRLIRSSIVSFLLSLFAVLHRNVTGCDHLLL